MNYTIDTDGKTVWVNGEINCLGRFGVMGIDVHRTLDEQSENGECLYCTHEPTNKQDWETFKVKIKEHFDIDVSDKYMPERFKS